VELPDQCPGHRGYEESAQLKKFTPGSFWYNPETLNGTLKFLLDAQPEAGSVVRIRREKSFHAAGADHDLSYLGSSRFDRQRGLLLSTDATYTWQEGVEK